MRSRRLGIGGILLVFATVSAEREARAADPPAGTSAVTAVVARVMGKARMASRGEEPVEPFQALTGGETLRVEHGYVVLVCSTDHVVRLAGEQSWRLSADRCRADGRWVPRIYGEVAPRFGRKIERGGAPIAEAEVRGDPGKEILLAPRNTAVATPRPKLLWRRMADAKQYQIEIPGLGEAVWLPAAEAACGAHADWPGIEVCQAELPAGLADLMVGRVVYPAIGYQRGLAGLPLQERYKGAVRLLPPSELEAVRIRIDALSGLPAGTREALASEVFAAAGLRADAIEAYRRSLAAEPAPEARARLGRLYLEADLPSFAKQELLAALAEPLAAGSVKAAALWGLAQIAYAGKEFAEAQALALKAAALFQTLGWTQEEAAAKSLATRSGERKELPS
jgi:hypothetical protein